MGSSQSRPVRAGRSWSFAGTDARRRHASERNSFESYYEHQRATTAHRSPYSGDTSMATSPTTPRITFADSDRLGEGEVLLVRENSLLDKMSTPSLSLDGKGGSRHGRRAKRAATLRSFTSASTRSGSGSGPRRIGRSRASSTAARLRQLLARISRQPHLTTEDGELIRLDNLPVHLVLNPSDLDQEIDRQHIDHYMLRLGLSGNRFAPVTTPSCVLDIGTGSGIWMLEMAVEYPDCEFVGIDIADYQHRANAENCDFRRMNILDGLRFPDDRFDLVFQRMVSSFIP
ncbi:S-adenosyl-L-methionine-dependent methyltransferase, partial [Syncephalis pseudoplumigaleata]